MDKKNYVVLMVLINYAWLFYPYISSHTFKDGICLNINIYAYTYHSLQEGSSPPFFSGTHPLTQLAPPRF